MNKQVKRKTKKKKMKLNKKRCALFILIIILLFYISIKHIISYTESTSSESDNLYTSANISKEPTPIINEKDYNENYLGIGQQKIKNMDGYFTTFTTTDGKTYKEYKQNGQASWANNKYWGGTMTENGCGITALSILLSGFGSNYTPDDLREKYYPVLIAEKISKELSNTFEIKNSDFYYDSVHLSNSYIEEYLQTNMPILICVWNKPTDNIWTSASHYMLLLATDGNEKVYVSNPNGLENEDNSSGWYDLNEITPYLAKALYINM